MSSKSLRTGRRKFLKGAVVTGGGAVLAGIAAGSQAELEPQEKQVESKPESQGYRETAHVREYYAKARF
ncbi:MAG: twin-arginine translocation signal domain-containing protein [Gammaproteobacteria bacterium]|nr:twin-arginine translocation signal domain-containing protein [Gammaproteobacteria bacterium]